MLEPWKNRYTVSPALRRASLSGQTSQKDWRSCQRLFLPTGSLSFFFIQQVNFTATCWWWQRCRPHYFYYLFSRLLIHLPSPQARWLSFIFKTQPKAFAWRHVAPRDLRLKAVDAGAGWLAWCDGLREGPPTQLHPQAQKEPQNMSLPGSASECKPRKEDLLPRVKGWRGLRPFTPPPPTPQSRARWAGAWP